MAHVLVPGMLIDAEEHKDDSPVTNSSLVGQRPSVTVYQLPTRALTPTKTLYRSDHFQRVNSRADHQEPNESPHNSDDGRPRRSVH